MRCTPLLLILAGCTAIVPSTAFKLRGFDPLTADPGALAVAIELPPGLNVRPGTVSFSMSVANPNLGNKAEQWTLLEGSGSDGRLVFRFDPNDIKAVRNLQAKAVAWEEKDPAGTKGNISIGLGACRTMPADQILGSVGSVFVSINPDEPPLPFILDAPITQLLHIEDLAQLPDC